VREMVLPRIERHGAINAWIVDIPAFRRRESIRLVWRTNTAGNWASRPYVWLKFMFWWEPEPGVVGAREVYKGT